MVRLIIFLVPLLDVLWYAWAWWRVRNFPHKAWWRGGITAFFILMFSHFVWMMLHRSAQVGVGAPPLTLGMAYIWHLLLLPLLSALIIVVEAAIGGWKGIRYLARRRPEAPAVSHPAAVSTLRPASSAEPATLTRRQFLTMAAVATPPALTMAFGIGGYAQSQGFHIRRMEVDLPGLPRDLDGATIAHLSDIHAGKFSDEKLLAKIVAATNDLRSDIILLTGDLIDFSLNDLPNATDAMRRLSAPGGVHMCEGNHDLFESRDKFEQGVRNSGLNILINQSETVKLRGRDVQLHGLRWGSGASVHGHRRDGAAEQNLEILKPNISPEAFSILLAHHPHAFDAATGLGIPLVLSGHTHGGQFMLSGSVGAGPLMFKYWSGLYRKGVSRLVVSNGTGNWLPLRINAPAEIIQITLRATALA